MVNNNNLVLNEFIKAKGLRVTGQRNEILDYFFHCGKHLTPKELFIELRKLYPKMGRATVYRTLKLLKDADLAIQVDFGNGSRKIENLHNKPHHDHMICTSCGMSIEFMDPKIEKLQEKITRKNNFVFQRHHLDIYGLCAKCAGKTAKIKKGGIYELNRT
jgi:Fur family ferric uptake transcriptional regulator